MLRVKIIALGTMKEKFYQLAAEEYIKRLSRYCKLEMVELSDISVPDNPSDGEIEKVLKAEGQMIISKIGNSKNVVALCIEGKMISSEELSQMLVDSENEDGQITFLIGSSHGLYDEVKKMASKRISFSKMTFPHQMARVILLEQIYRGFKIKSGENYHK